MTGDVTDLLLYSYNGYVCTLSIQTWCSRVHKVKQKQNSKIQVCGGGGKNMDICCGGGKNKGLFPSAHRDFERKFAAPSNYWYDIQYE